MKRILTVALAASMALSFASTAGAVPASDDMGKSISEMENPEKKAQPVTKKAKKPAKQTKKPKAKKAAPASEQKASEQKATDSQH